MPITLHVGRVEHAVPLSSVAADGVAQRCRRLLLCRHLSIHRPRHQTAVRAE